METSKISLANFFCTALVIFMVCRLLYERFCSRQLIADKSSENKHQEFLSKNYRGQFYFTVFQTQKVYRFFGFG